MKNASNTLKGKDTKVFKEPSDHYIKFGEYQFVSKINSAQYI